MHPEWSYRGAEDVSSRKFINHRGASSQMYIFHFRERGWLVLGMAKQETHVLI